MAEQRRLLTATASQSKSSRSDGVAVDTDARRSGSQVVARSTPLLTIMYLQQDAERAADLVSWMPPPRRPELDAGPLACLPAV